MMKHPAARVLIVVALLHVSAAAAAAEDTLDTARQLYAAAAYDEALAMLDRLHGASDAPAPELEQERALCLLALNRIADAERAIGAVVQANPAYVPDGSVSPRVRATFQDVRARLLPDIARSVFAKARAAYDRKEYAQALHDLDVLLTLTRDLPEGLRGNDDFENLKLLAEGFRILSEAALKTVETPAAIPQEVASIERIFDATVPGVVPPVVVKQDVPEWRPLMGPPPRTPGLIAVTIDEEGTVERLEIIRSLHASYDALLQAAAQKWSYVPASHDGVKVKFRKSIRLALR
jgi:tetratricopeptide (TPR) repeat protein